jgi:hypothetical protein
MKRKIRITILSLFFKIYLSTPNANAPGHKFDLTTQIAYCDTIDDVNFDVHAG